MYYYYLPYSGKIWRPILFGEMPRNYDAIFGLIVDGTVTFEIDSCIREFGEELNLVNFKLLAKSPNFPSIRYIFVYSASSI